MTLPSADPDIAARAALARHRAIATGLLLIMAALTVGSYWLPQGTATEILQAAAKAGFVGGIADWFAITALFRHPLGLPIPHTAIIPAQKARLGRALGRFVATHVFTEAEVARTLGRLDLTGILRRYLADPASTRPAAEALAAMLPRLLATIEDGRARRVAARIIPRLLGGPDAGRVVGRALRQLVEGGRHQEVFGFILGQLKTLLAEREEAIQAAIEERVREQGGRLVGWALGASIARRVLGLISAELDKMEPDGSELRAAFDEWMRREIARIEDEPARAAEIGAALRRVLAHETVRAWFWDVWSRLRLAMEADAGRPNGRTVAFLEGALANLGVLLESDPTARARVQHAVEGIASSLLPAAQAQMSDFIADVVTGWDTATITDKLELRIGKDLQYVRINGTLVGFLVGGLVYAVLRATFGHVSF
ncbi:DUF445 domain-containing protein [Limobrevibacterium gyesilva]|uniref:DUF445 domain-containing protein n=1 Tax=Limobrevibacterium gyesilva TaxID=2991712 RepID=A0AA42CFL9_9PROT|nr:DUF445 domain-containing protein [Limobrevibacterium gyesilva]MCW3476794.1 DUF445 domain-containing protein [Limobrevibacterium gyesilva]